MNRFVQSFVRDESGGAATDWIVLVLGVVILSLGMFSSLDKGATQAASRTGEFVAAYDPQK